MKVKELKFTINHGFHGISRKQAFFTEDGQFHGKCHGRELGWSLVIKSKTVRVTEATRGANSKAIAAAIFGHSVGVNECTASTSANLRPDHHWSTINCMG